MLDWIKNLFIKIVGKNLQTTIDGDLVKWGISKAKLAFILSGLVGAAPEIAKAFGYTIPPEILSMAYKLLVAVGLWATRDAIQNPAIVMPPQGNLP